MIFFRCSRRGVAVVVIPGDVALRDAVEQRLRLHFADPMPMVRPSDDEISELARILNDPDKTTISGGAGCAGAHEELIALAGTLKAPIVHALRGKEFVEYDNPRCWHDGVFGFLLRLSRDDELRHAANAKDGEKLPRGAKPRSPEPSEQFLRAMRCQSESHNQSQKQKPDIHKIVSLVSRRHALMAALGDPIGLQCAGANDQE